MNEKDIVEVIDMLASADPAERANMASVLVRTPIADARIAKALEAKLDDKTLCVLSIPYELGEVRWAIAHALHATRNALGDRERIGVEQVIKPITVDRIVELAREAGLPAPKTSGVAGAIERLEELRKRGLVPTQSLILG
jgi:hypothetical protein